MASNMIDLNFLTFLSPQFINKWTPLHQWFRLRYLQGDIELYHTLNRGLDSTQAAMKLFRKRNTDILLWIKFHLFACVFAEIIIMSYIETIDMEFSLFKTKLPLLEAISMHFEGRYHFLDKNWPFLRALSCSGKIFENWIRSLDKNSRFGYGQKSRKRVIFGNDIYRNFQGS